MDSRVEIRKGKICRREQGGKAVHVKLQGTTRWILAYLTRCRMLTPTDGGELLWEVKFTDPANVFVPGQEVAVKIAIKPDGWISVLRMTTLENYYEEVLAKEGIL